MIQCSKTACILCICHRRGRRSCCCSSSSSSSKCNMQATAAKASPFPRPRSPSASAAARALVVDPLSFLARVSTSSSGPLTALSASPLRRADPSGSRLDALSPRTTSAAAMTSAAGSGETGDDDSDEAKGDERIRAGAPTGGRRGAALPSPSPPREPRLWFPAYPAEATGGGAHSRRWRRFWRSRRVRRAAAVPGARSRILGCLVAPAAAAVEGVAAASAALFAAARPRRGDDDREAVSRQVLSAVLGGDALLS